MTSFQYMLHALRTHMKAQEARAQMQVGAAKCHAPLISHIGFYPFWRILGITIKRGWFHAFDFNS